MLNRDLRELEAELVTVIDGAGTVEDGHDGASGDLRTLRRV